MKVIPVRDVFEPRRASLGSNGVAFQILEFMDGRVLMEHDG
jgi:hypothetical protein